MAGRIKKEIRDLENDKGSGVSVIAYDPNDNTRLKGVSVESYLSFIM